MLLYIMEIIGSIAKPKDFKTSDYKLCKIKIIIGKVGKNI